MSAPLLTESDISYAKLIELQRRLESATRAGRIKWARIEAGSFRFTTPSGVVGVAAGQVNVWDRNGVNLRRFKPVTDELFQAVTESHSVNVQGVIDALLADIEVPS